MEFKKVFNKSIFIWCGLFAASAVVGALAYKTMLPHMIPLMATGLAASEGLHGGPGTAAFIFAKNVLVACLCILLGRITRGILPGFVCVLNGCVLGFVGALLCKYGNVAWWRYVLALSPHGVIELAAIFAACVIGMLAATGKEKTRLAKIPIAMLAVAACIETWLSMGLADRLL